MPGIFRGFVSGGRYGQGEAAQAPRVKWSERDGVDALLLFGAIWCPLKRVSLGRVKMGSPLLVLLNAKY